MSKLLKFSLTVDFNGSFINYCKPLNCSSDNNRTTTNSFLSCYRQLYQYRWMLNTLEILLAVLIVAFNTLVIIILARKPTKMSIFDKIMIAHCIVDGLTGLLDVPFFHFAHVLGFWPFGNTASLFWTTFDNGINGITNMHMLYMTLIRFRSIRSPNTFEKERIAKYPVLVCISIWVIGLLIWGPVAFSYGVADCSTAIKFKPAYMETIFILFTWFIPLIVIIVLAALILVILNKRRRQVASLNKFSSSVTCITTTGVRQIRAKINFMRKLKTYFRLGPQIRFQIIIASYWLQWFPSCLIALIDPICAWCVPANFSMAVYWLTYTVCLTDPLVILFFNPNVALHASRKGNFAV